MAVRAALAMRRELRALNERWFAEGIVPFAIGTGINQGDVLGGNIGSQEKADPTVIGDAVNLASRLESLTRTYGADILLGPTATELVRDKFHVRSVARVQVKGKTEPVEIAALIGARNEALDADYLRHLEPTSAAFKNSGNAIFGKPRSCSRSSWNFTLTISWPRCIWSVGSSTRERHPMTHGTQSKFSSGSNLVIPSEVEGGRVLRHFSLRQRRFSQ